MQRQDRKTSGENNSLSQRYVSKYTTNIRINKMKYFSPYREKCISRNIPSELSLHCSPDYNPPFLIARSVLLLYHPLSSGTSSMLLLFHLHPGPVGHNHHQHGQASHCQDPNGPNKGDSVPHKNLGSKRQKSERHNLFLCS